MKWEVYSKKLGLKSERLGWYLGTVITNTNRILVLYRDDKDGSISNINADEAILGYD